jgi:TetR/AcrR family transcriptional regulator
MTKLSSQQRPRPRVAAEERDGDTEQRILQAARSVFIRRGTSGARMQEIAAEAGVNQALLHYYFRSKQRLAEAVFREAAGRLIPAVLRLLGSDAPLEQKVEGFVHLYIDTVREQPFLPGYILAELHQHPERVKGLQEAIGLQPAMVAKTLLAKLRTELEAGAANGTLRRIAPEQFMVSLLGLTVFPFAARPVLELALGMNDDGFARFLDQRRAELPAFILSALRP